MTLLRPILVLFVLTIFSCSKEIANDFHSENYYKRFADLSAFPGAEGYGTKTIAGRGGIIYKVTNLNDNGPGSLRHGLSLSEPRSILFEVSGVILLKSSLIILNPFISIYGQTAPSPGITISQCGLSVETHDVLIQHISVRPGDNLNGCPPDTRDGIVIANYKKNNTAVYNVVIDHCSFSWALDENASVWGGCSDVTFSHCIFSHGLHQSLHSKGGHSKGLLIGDYNQRISIYKNIFAYNDERNPRIAGNTSVEFINNLVFGCNHGLQLLDANHIGPVELWAERNIFLPEKNINHINIKSINPKSKILLQDNIDKKKEIDLLIRNKINNQEIEDRDISILHKDKLLEYLYKKSGATPSKRNSIDAELFQSINQNNGKIIDCVSEYSPLASGVITQQKSITLEIVFQENLIRSYKGPLFISTERNPQLSDIDRIEHLKNSNIILEKNLPQRSYYRSPVYIFKKCDNYSLVQLSTIKAHHKISVSEEMRKDLDGNGYSELEDWIFSLNN